MTTGEYLVSKSSLATGSALAHLLSMQTGTGTGETVFASTVCVFTSVEQIEVTQKTDRQMRQVEPVVAARKSMRQPKDDKPIFVFTADDHLYVHDEQIAELFITASSQLTTVTQLFDQAVINKRGLK